MSFLSKVLVVSALIAAVFGQTTAPYNDVTANHYVGLFSGSLYFPYATDVCQPLNLYGTSFAKYTCLNSSALQYQFYTDSSCTTTQGSAGVFTKNSSLTSGSAEYFDCSGSDGYYTLVGLSAQTTNASEAKTQGCQTSAQQIVAAAVHACSPGATGTQFSVYCDSTHAELQYFYTGTCVARSYFLKSVSAYTGCDYLFSAATTTGGSTITVYVYGQMNSCQLGTTTTTTTTTTTKKSSGSIHFSTLSLILSVLAYIMA